MIINATIETVSYTRATATLNVIKTDERLCICQCAYRLDIDSVAFILIGFDCQSIHRLDDDNLF